MAFLKKLGNAAGDFASFAVPAGLSLGAAALTGGGAAAIGGPQVLAALGAGAGGFKRNEEEERIRKHQLAQNKNQSMANLINQLSSRPNYQAKQAPVPSAGFMEQLAGGAQMGIQAYQAAQAAQQAAEDRDLQNKVAKAELEQLQASSDAQAGAGRYAMDRLGENRVENAIRDNMGTIRTEQVEAPGIFKPGRTGTRLTLSGGPGSLDVEKARTAQDQLQRAMGPTSGLNANEARGYVGALDKDAENRTKSILDIEQQDLQRREAESLDRYRQGQLDAARRKSEATLQAKLIGDRIDFQKAVNADENTLRGDFTQLNKSFEQVRDSYQRINSVDADTPMGQISLVFGIMKMNDPISTVREGEYATAENAAGVPARLRNMYNRIVDGERLGTDQVDDIRAQAGNLYRAQLTSFNNSVEQFKGIAERRGLDWRNIIVGGPTGDVVAEPADPAQSNVSGSVGGGGWSPEEVMALQVASSLVTRGSLPESSAESTGASFRLLSPLSRLTGTSSALRDSMAANNSVFRR